MDFKLILQIGIGSFIGGVLRYLMSLAFQSKFISTYPFGTFIVNIIGCFLIGLVYALAEKGNIGQEWRLVLATGVLGGFTTFSAFSQETFKMLLDGQFLNAGIYIFSSVLLGLIATFLGAAVVKLF